MFRAPIHYDRDDDAIVFASGDAAARVLPSDDAMRRAIGDQADRALAGLRNGPSVVERVRAQIRASFSDGDIRVTSVARALGVGERTLRRRLEEEGVRFQTLRDQERCSRARTRLDDGTASISDIAFELGFADSAAFHRAFRRWTGQTPSEYRARRST